MSSVTTAPSFNPGQGVCAERAGEDEAAHSGPLCLFYASGAAVHVHPRKPPHCVELQAEIERRQLSRTVLMLGWRLDTGALLSVSDVLVVPSRTEALPLPLLEAARQSRPVVAARVGGILEVIDEGMTGYAVPPGDPPSLAAAVLRILDEPGASQRMGAAARLRLRC